jgi:glutamyl-tRNA(Gln) amidotransferase subunit E
LKDLSRNGIKIENIQDDAFEKIFSSLAKGKIVAKAIPKILKKVAEGGSIEKTIAGFEIMSSTELEKIISDAVKETPDKNISSLMGIVMAKLKGRADGKVVMEILKKMVK